ncbi:DUF1841 family protein [Chitinimonas taiwanensis]|uniref:DUF1841 domain-containing protein n=1 Tax=Chitinimonas taiwanensis DSM 18899 TaxID=1121279 RepID=A0A1K2HNC0_9NEIS|nr:DUF1841 family protein [Chitinimonas taiwanensis]SFZ78197.1 protein of unknown function [Chitinimonas taiwanensis DSM 18899]
MFNPSRDQARQFLFDTWAKHKQQAALTDLERIAFAVLTRHPEYQPIVDAPERYRDKDYLPEFGETNPFLHMSMHLAIEEQLSIDQPTGVRALYRALCEHSGDEHRAQHEMMDCLAEMIWQAQRSGTGPDGALYLACMRRKAGLDEAG